MPHFHLDCGQISRGQSTGGATGYAHYISREDVAHASQHERYLVREGHERGSDLVASGTANLPAWAHEGKDFWKMAEQYERKGGLVARTWEVLLPRELSPAQRLALAEDIRTVHFSQHVHTWAVHNPKTLDGTQEHPHMHVMVSERVCDGIDRTPKQFFSRAAETAAQGGAKKDRRWNDRHTLTDIRASVAMLTNAALERSGQQLAVSPLSLKDRGFSREAERAHTRKDNIMARHGVISPRWQTTMEQRQQRDPMQYAREEAAALKDWHALRVAKQVPWYDRAEMRQFASRAWEQQGQEWHHTYEQHRAVQKDRHRENWTREQRALGIAGGHEQKPRRAVLRSLTRDIPSQAAPLGHMDGPQLQQLHESRER